jgi:glutamate synthase (NADPH/NADH)
MAISSSDIFYNQKPDSAPLVSEPSSLDDNGFHSVKRDPNSWDQSLPADQGLYLSEYEKDSCGVGFICHIKGEQSHKIVSDARQLLCAMTHRGATGADSRDGDGAGVMTGIPHLFFQREAEREIGCILPQSGEYAVGNVFFKANDPIQLQNFQTIFSNIASGLGLRVLGWREVPTDGTILGPAASSKEPAIHQPFVVLREHYGDSTTCQNGPFDAKQFERQLYVLRKHATHTMFVFFYSSRVMNPAQHRSDFLVYKVRSRKASTSVRCPRRILCIRGSFLLPKYTITTMISITSCTVPTLLWCIPDSPQTRSLLGTVHSQ